MSTQDYRVTRVPLPPESRIAKSYATANLADAYSIELPAAASTNPELLARFILAHRSPWVSRLIAVRDSIVGRLGLKTAKQFTSHDADNEAARIGIFKMYGASPDEIILGEDDKHLDFRLSVSCSNLPSPGGKRRLIFSTVVHCHNRLGRFYLFVIAPFHRLVVQSSLRSAAQIGWPLATEA